MDFRVHVFGDEEKARALRQLAAFMRDLRPFWPMVVPLFIRWMREQFESEGAWGGNPWAPLTPAYAARKAMTHPGRSILIAEGDLRQAASSPSRNAGPTRLVLTISDPKVAFHQDGTEKMVARPVVPDPLPSSALRDLEDAANEYVDDVIARLGL